VSLLSIFTPGGSIFTEQYLIIDYNMPVKCDCQKTTQILKGSIFIIFFFKRVCVLFIIFCPGFNAMKVYPFFTKISTLVGLFIQLLMSEGFPKKNKNFIPNKSDYLEMMKKAI